MSIEWSLTSSGKYAKEPICQDGLNDCKTICTPMVPTEKLAHHIGEPLDSFVVARYHSSVGGLQYLTLTRPHIAFAVNKVYQYLQCPATAHLMAVKRIQRILRYISGTKDYGLQFVESSSLYVSAFSDADWVGYSDDHKSTRGFAVYLGENLVSWHAKKQAMVSRSSIEAEYNTFG